MTAATPAIAVDYDEKLGRFLCDIEQKHLEFWAEPPLWLYESALQARRAQVDLSAFRHATAYLDRLSEVWAGLRGASTVDKVTLVLAQHYPSLSTVKVDFDPAAPGIVALTLPASAELRAWRYHWVEAHINAEIARRGLDAVIDHAQFRTAFARAAYYGETVFNRAMQIRPRRAPLGAGSYELVVDAERLEVDLHVFDVRPLAEPLVRRTLFREIERSLWALAQAVAASPVCRTVFDDLEQTLNRALDGPAALGIGLPLILPAGFFLRDEEQLPQLADPAAMACMLGKPVAGGDDDLPRTRIPALLRRRGLLSDAGLNTRTRLFPVVPVDRLLPKTRRRYLDLTGKACQTLPVEEREQQALTIAVPARAAARYVEAVAAFWREQLAERATPAGADATVVALSHWLPLSYPWAERAARAGGEAAAPYDGASWLPLIVRELVGMDRITASPEGLAACLIPEVSAGAVRKALEALAKSGLVHYDSVYKRYRQTNRNVMTGNDLDNDRIRNIHEELAELCADTLERAPDQCRTLAVTARLEAATFYELKARLRQWLEGLLSSNARETDADQVCLLGIHVALHRDRDAAELLQC